MTDPAYYPEPGRLAELLGQISPSLDARMSGPVIDPLENVDTWRYLSSEPIPAQPSPIDDMVRELATVIVPNGSRVSDPGFWAYVANGPTSAPFVAATAMTMASPVRYGTHAFNAIEERSLEWLAEIFGLGPDMRGLYTSGGSTANLVALGGARQSAFESRGLDPARDGLGSTQCAIYVSSETHHTIQRSAAVLGIGRSNVREIAIDDNLRIIPAAVAEAIDADVAAGIVPIAVVANAGATNTGTIDPLRAVGDVARERGVWFHVDGAYGLPGYLDARIRDKYDGLAEADSAIVDPHKWLSSGPGIGAVFVRDRALLQRAFTQGPADYLEGSFAQDGKIESSLDVPGIPYGDFGVELTAPPRGIQVWAILKEQGLSGLTARIMRDNDFARYVATAASEHPLLESLTRPDLSVACIRYVGDGSIPSAQLDSINTRIHRRLVRETEFLPSATVVHGHYVIRPCFVNPRTPWSLVESFLPAVVRLGNEEAGSPG